MTRDSHRPLREAWIVEAVRTPIGRYGGALAGVRPDDLAALVLRAVVDRAGLDPALVEDVILGCANQAGEDNRDVARMALLLAGLPGRGRRADRQPAVRLGPAGDQLGRPRDRGRRRRRVHRRRRRVDDAGRRTSCSRPKAPTSAATGSSSTRRSAGASSTRDSRDAPPVLDGRDRGERRRAMGRSAASARTPSRSRASAATAAAIEAGRFDDQLVPDLDPAEEGRPGRRVARRASARGHDRRGAREAAARLREGGRLASRPATAPGSTTAPRRCCSWRPSGRVRSACGRWPASSRPRSPASTRRSWASARCRPSRKALERAGIAVGGPRPHRAQRGVRVAGTRPHGRAGPRPGEGQRQRRRDRPRPPARDERRPPRHDARPTSCGGPAAATASPRCASASVRGSRPSWSASTTDGGGPSATRSGR